MKVYVCWCELAAFCLFVCFMSELYDPWFILHFALTNLTSQTEGYCLNMAIILFEICIICSLGKMNKLNSIKVYMYSLFIMPCINCTCKFLSWWSTCKYCMNNIAWFVHSIPCLTWSLKNKRANMALYRSPGIAIRSVSIKCKHIVPKWPTRWQPYFLTDQNSLNNIGKGPDRDATC